MLILLGGVPALIRKVPLVTERGEWKVISDGAIGTRQLDAVTPLTRPSLT